MADSRPETLTHIRRVQGLLLTDVASRLHQRAIYHDASKLESPEVEGFDEAAGTLSELTYGSDEYKAALARLKPALDHHYANNSHHPEYYADGVNDMTLLDLIEMLCDWKAATERHDDGDIRKSLKINEQRFCIDYQLAKILENTVNEMGW
jgi:hypothetical protein